jgi:prepilin-type N-terminal cleavage/methylation domain-containing protein
VNRLVFLESLPDPAVAGLQLGATRPRCARPSPAKEAHAMPQRSISPPRRPSPGFTLVELLVVIGITALLLGLLLAAMNGARDRARVSSLENNLRQVGMAWTMYANNNNDGVLPGYLSASAQADWSVRYRYGDGSVIPPHPSADEVADSEKTNVAGPWVWRLLPYADHREQLVTVHRDEMDFEDMTPDERAWAVREEPAFGYNGLFVGGWWLSGDHHAFRDATVHETNRRVSVVSRHLGSIGDPAGLLIFASSAERGPGLERYDMSDDDDGSFMVTPPIVGTNELWGLTTQLDAPAEGEGEGTNFSQQLGGHVYAIEYYGSGNWLENPAPFG